MAGSEFAAERPTLRKRKVHVSCVLLRHRSTNSSFSLDLALKDVEVERGDVEDVESLKEAFKAAYGAFGLTNCENSTYQNRCITDSH